jgi:hypothetical protein
MKPARPIVITLLLAASAAIAHAADQAGAGLQACIDNARQADATCSKLTNDPSQRLDCFQRARDEQLACLQRALPDIPARTTTTDGDRGAQPREPAPKAATSDAPPQPSPQETAQKKALDGKNAADGSTSNVTEPSGSRTATDAPSDTASITTNSTPAPQPPATPTVESPPAARQADAVGEPKSPAKELTKDSAVDLTKSPAKMGTPADTTSATTNSTPAPQPPATPTIESPSPARQVDAVSEPKTPTKELTKELTKTPAKADTPAGTASTTTNIAPAPQPPATLSVESPPPTRQAVTEPKNPAGDSARTPDKPLAKTPDRTPDRTPDKMAAPAAKQPESTWVVSEMPSPIDYRPLLTAVIRPTSRSEGGPSGLTIRCLGGQTGISIYTEGAWHAARKNALPVDHQINDQSVVRQTWTLSTDAKSATYTGDPVALLRSLPEGTRLTINVPDGANARNEATFLLAGWEAVRKRIGTTCKWPKANAQASSGH